MRSLTHVRLFGGPNTTQDIRRKRLSFKRRSRIWRNRALSAAYSGDAVRQECRFSVQAAEKGILLWVLFFIRIQIIDKPVGNFERAFIKGNRLTSGEPFIQPMGDLVTPVYEK